MNRVDIDNCHDIEELKKLCHAYRHEVSSISETLVDLSKDHITNPLAIEDIKLSLRRIQNVEDKFVKYMDSLEEMHKTKLEKLEKYYGKISIGSNLRVLQEFTDFYEEGNHTYKVGEIYTIISISYETENPLFVLQYKDPNDFCSTCYVYIDYSYDMIELFEKANE